MTEATKEILAREQRDVRNEGDSISEDKAESPLINGTTKRPKSAKPDTMARSITSSSAVKPPASVMRSLQPTPTREYSILGTLKPRRRQPSILRNLDHESSSFEVYDEDEFLPDDESTPVHATRSQNSNSTPATKSSQIPSSRKRKLDAIDHVLPDKEVNVHTQPLSPLPTGLGANRTPEPALPPVPLSTLRESGRKQRERLAVHDDVMALPESSSSPMASPVKAKATSARKTRQRTTNKVPVMKTEELQALMMPTKRRRTARERNLAPDGLDTPVGSHSDGPKSSQNDDSSFLPRQKGRKTRQKTLVAKPSKRQRTVRDGAHVAITRKPGTIAAAAAKSKSKPSTKHLITTTTPPPAPSATSSPRRVRETKSPSQLSSVEFSNIHNQIANRVTPRRSERGQKWYGGSLRRGKGPVDGPDKENQEFPDGHLDEAAIEHSKVASVPPPNQHLAGGQRKTSPKRIDKWAEIDAWDMDFEDVEAMTGSGDSSPMRR